MLKKIFASLVLLLLLLVIGAGAALYWFVVVEPGDEIAKENIRSILGRESPVYYNDGVTPLGVFFEDAHRQYIEYEEIPTIFIDALVAAEDNRFFSHFGFDIQGITRAAIKNIEAGRVVQGGSTLTQQTAKNLFKRQERSYQAKFKELIYALRLEYHYSKEQILEFYCNQFYVSGNGHGLGVAARYYFDKTPGELTLIEAAYIAGSVKRPNYYNPFIKKGQKVDEAVERGKSRVGYVLAKMREMGTISDLDYQHARYADIPFNQGKVGYALDYVMELVTEAVASKRVLDAMSVHGFDNIATSGIRVITSVEQSIQRKTLSALRKQLSILDVRLRGYERDEVQKDLADIDYLGDRNLDTGNFLFGTITAISRDKDQLSVEVDVGIDDTRGIIDRDGLQALVDARVKWQKNPWAETKPEDFLHLLEQLQEGDRVWVSVRSVDEQSGLRFDLERFPEVQGGAIVLRNGRIISVAGGVENRFFNRAVYGKRTMGSSYKPFVYAAALQLGWNAADLLPNRRDVFIYQNQAYFPRPDHTPDSEQVSMSWAGVRSENLASVWLAAHLCDHLSQSQFEDVAEYLGMTPRVVDGEPEPYRLFRSRIRDRFGIVIDQDVLRQAAYRKTVVSIEDDLIFAGFGEEYGAVQGMHYGLGFDQFQRELAQQLREAGGSEQERNELFLRKKILIRNFLSFSELNRQLRFLIDANTGFNSAADSPSKPPSNGGRLFFDRSSGIYIFDFPAYAPESAEAVSGWQLRSLFERFDPFEEKAFIEGIRIGNTISVGAFDFVAAQLQSEYQKLSGALPYSMEILQYVDDYRIMVGLQYLMAFGRFLGIESELEPVLSFPLGSNVVTLLETTRVYEGLISGEINLFTEENGEINDTLAIIDRIESEDGLVLFRPEPSKRRGVSTKTALVLGHILENTVKFGTGRYADTHVKMSSAEKQQERLDELDLSVPLFGKTGTANSYTNASFFGYLPLLNEEGNAMVIDGGYGVGVYVGYDNNKPMRRRATRVTGSLGALPAWTDIVNAIVSREDFAAGLDPVDLSFYGLAIERHDIGQENLAVAKSDGGRLIYPLQKVDPLDRYQPSIITFGARSPEGTFRPARSFAPFWLNQIPKRVDVVPSSAVASPEVAAPQP